jgi:cell division protein FtsB
MANSAAVQQPLTRDVETGDAETLALAGVTLPEEPALKGPLKPVVETTMKERLAALVAACAIITSLLAMIVEGGPIVLVAGILSIILGPYAYIQQTNLTDIATLTETTEVVKQEVNKLKAENARLETNINELGETIDKLQDVEEALEVISKTTGKSVSALEEQVKEHRAILEKMKQSTKGRIIQNLISVIYRGDTNADDAISEEEADKVIAGLKQISGLKVKEDKLKSAIAGKTIDAVIDVVKNLLSDAIPPEDRIFELPQAAEE